jgi:hypothetical protein
MLAHAHTHARSHKIGRTHARTDFGTALHRTDTVFCAQHMRAAPRSSAFQPQRLKPRSQPAVEPARSAGARRHVGLVALGPRVAALQETLRPAAPQQDCGCIGGTSLVAETCDSTVQALPEQTASHGTHRGLCSIAWCSAGRGAVRQRMGVEAQPQPERIIVNLPARPAVRDRGTIPHAKCGVTADDTKGVRPGVACARTSRWKSAVAPERPVANLSPRPAARLAWSLLNPWPRPPRLPRARKMSSSVGSTAKAISEASPDAWASVRHKQRAESKRLRGMLAHAVRIVRRPLSSSSDAGGPASLVAVAGSDPAESLLPPYTAALASLAYT